MENNLPNEVQFYLDEIVKRLTDYLKGQLVGVYLFGSASYDAYEPGLSDLDVQAIVKSPLKSDEKQAIISRLSQNNLSCPATKLEFVLYAQSSVNPANRHPRFELNLNTGPHQSDHVSLDPANESSHWFLLDIAMGRQLGRCLYGSPITEAFGAIPLRWVLEGMADSLEWHQENEASSTNSVLNACRSWRFIVTGEFCSKLDGAEWAMRQPDCPAIVERAIAARKTGINLAASQVMELYHIVVRANRSKLETEVD
ncbi:Streptomycin 3''-adenylyltransferase [Fusarium austroafricanum]|uniref:Streptomycin 3''-adenylyltransferase n=1 Tax=Fusarium austroafricanum TaxID=2364996 RepID=A0A8H4KTP9_9HYPO|nr:Streptomycin 3''-adenylyltransferase [Fusarium austroafricanum]